MKKIMIKVLIIMMCLMSFSQFVYVANAATTKKNQLQGSTSNSRSNGSIQDGLRGFSSHRSSDDSTWVQNAFSSANGFLKEKPVDETGVVKPIFKKFKDIVKTINVILIVLLSGLSIIALSITGVRYIISGASPGQKEQAKKSLNTILIGMAIGFGAFIIWRIAMAIIGIFIETMAASG